MRLERLCVPGGIGRAGGRGSPKGPRSGRIDVSANYEGSYSNSIPASRETNKEACPLVCVLLWRPSSVLLAFSTFDRLAESLGIDIHDWKTHVSYRCAASGSEASIYYTDRLWRAVRLGRHGERFVFDGSRHLYQRTFDLTFALKKRATGGPSQILATYYLVSTYRARPTSVTLTAITSSNPAAATEYRVLTREVGDDAECTARAAFTCSQV